MSTPDRFDPSLLKAIGHPLRLRIVEAITDRGEASPVELARELGHPLGTVSHHTRVLRDLGWIEVTRTAQRRGALEHFYRATRRPFIDDAEWERLPLSMRRGLARQTVCKIFAEASRAGAAGGFDAPGAHVLRLPLELDELGVHELADILTETLEKADAVQRSSDARRDRAAPEGPRVASELAILHFAVADAPTPTTREREPRSRRAQRPALR